MQVKYKIGLCKGCELEKLIYHKGKKLCSTCNQKRLSKEAEARRKLKIAEGKALDFDKLKIFYKQFWDNQKEKICYETNEKLYEFNKWHVHHLLEKDKYMEAAYDFDNCVLLTLQQHSLWHGLTDKEKEKQMPKTYEKYLKIKEKYEQST
jgi:hypothetical protein